MKSSVAVLTSAVFLVLSAGAGTVEKKVAEMPDLTAYRAAWSEVRPSLDESIRTNRMGEILVTVLDAGGRPVPGAEVVVEQRQHEFLFGCNALVLGQMREKEAAWEAAFLKLFNLATTTFCLGAHEPVKGRFRFEDRGPDVWRRPPPDRLRDFCRKHGIAMKGQPLMAGSWHPKWAGRTPMAEGKAMYRDYFRRVAERYGDSLALVDVANESFAHWQFPLYDRDCDIEAWALETASSLFPKSCRLCINELSVVNGPMRIDQAWGSGDLPLEYYERVRKIKERGIRLDGVGFQFHIFGGGIRRVLALKQWSPDTMKKSYDRMASLGIPLYLTEITIPATLGTRDFGERIQAEVAENFYRFWFSHPGFAGITWWNLCDGAAHANEGSSLGGLLDADLREKPVYQKLYQLIRREWNTRERKETTKDGCARLRGFYGRYGARVSIAGTTESFDFDLLRGGSGAVTLKLKYRLPDETTKAALARYRAEWKALRPKLDADIDANRKVNCVIEVRDEDGNPMPNAEIAVRQKRHDFNFGCGALSLGQLDERNTAYETALVETFNLLTTTFCRNTLEPEPGNPRFAGGSEEVFRRPPPDRVLAFCRDNGLRMKGQPLLCDHWNPPWAKDFDRAATEQSYRDWFERVAKRYDGSVYMFDLVNEALSCKDRTPDFALYTPALDYVDWAFRTAAPLFGKETRLTLNEGTSCCLWGDHPEMSWRHTTGETYWKLAKRLLDQGIRLDGVGIQCHLFSSTVRECLCDGHFSAKDLLENFDRFGELGVPIYVSEVTVSSVGPEGVDGEALQAEMAENLYRLWFGRKNMSGITWWNLADGAAWEDEVKSLGGLLRADMSRKPAYERLQALIKKTWITSFKRKVNKNGRLAFRAFRGDYEIEIPDRFRDRKVHCIPVSLSVDGKEPIVISIPRP